MPDDHQHDAFNDAGRAQWDAKAQFWDALHGDEGNNFHRTLISPSVERLLNLQHGESVLDIACGSGVMARRLAELGAHVTATDFSTALLDRARARPQKSGTPIIYREADATDENALRSLGEGQWDAVTCTMAFMDMPILAPMMRAVWHLLKPNGRFVFATAHPAFNSTNPVFVAEMRDEGGEQITEYSLKIKAYTDIAPSLQVGARGEPTAHYYYHRSLEALLADAFEAGLMLDGIEEPTFTPDPDANETHLSWRHVWQLPPVLAGRFQRMG